MSRVFLRLLAMRGAVWNCRKLTVLSVTQPRGQEGHTGTAAPSVHTATRTTKGGRTRISTCIELQILANAPSNG